MAFLSRASLPGQPQVFLYSKSQLPSFFRGFKIKASKWGTVMTLVLTLVGTYLLAILATVLTVAFVSRGRERAPEGAVIAYGLLFLIWWAIILLAFWAWKQFR
jgi:heme/copper-type cytochrome/quinol oxidase subunit 2